MKTILTLLASVTLLTSVASAHPGCETPRRVVGYTRCGDPIIATYEYVGRDRCGDPIHERVTHYPREREVVRERPISISVPLPPLPFFLGGHERDHERHHDFGWNPSCR